MFDDKEVQEMRLTPLRVNATSLTMIEANVVTIMMVMIMLLMLIAIMICNNGDDDMDDDDKIKRFGSCLHDDGMDDGDEKIKRLVTGYNNG